MAAITITAANIGIGQGAVTQVYEVGENVTHGEVLYLDSLNNDHRLAGAAGALALAKARCISLTTGAADGSFVLGISKGSLILGAVLTKGVEYYVGPTVGTIVPKSDLTSGHYVTRLGIASSTSVLEVDILATGVTI